MQSKERNDGWKERKKKEGRKEERKKERNPRKKKQREKTSKNQPEQTDRQKDKEDHTYHITSPMIRITTSFSDSKTAFNGSPLSPVLPRTIPNTIENMITPKIFAPPSGSTIWPLGMVLEPGTVVVCVVKLWVPFENIFIVLSSEALLVKMSIVLFVVVTVGSPWMYLVLFCNFETSNIS